MPFLAGTAACEARPFDRGHVTVMCRWQAPNMRQETKAQLED
jgi:hypothetical protein